MITFILESAFIWLVGILFYCLLLKKETFFHFNRFFLIGVLFIGILFPLLKIPFGRDNAMVSYTLPVLELISSNGKSLQPFVENKVGNNHWLHQVLILLYLLGFSFVLTKFGKNLVKISAILRKNRKNHFPGFTEVIIHDGFTPFSFFRWMFIPKSLKGSAKYELIKKHELAHIKQWHSADIIFIEILRIVFWFNPLIPVFKRELIQNHEYMADQCSLNVIERFDYGNLLLSFNYAHSNLYLGNQLNNSIIKNRLIMMYKNRSGHTSQLKYLLVLPLFAMLFLVFSCEQKEEIKTDTEELKTENESSYSASLKAEVFTVVEEMPRFPGCEDLEGSMEEKQQCANNEMIQFIFRNLKYPTEARNAGIEGTVVAQFVVDEKGNIQDGKIVKDIGYGCGEEVLKIVNSMNDMDQKWIPGKQRGENVKVQFTLPVKFKLEDKK